jgi:hypothetical protein
MLQTVSDFLFRERIGDYPHAQFAVFQASMKVGHAGVDEILFRFMEKEEMSSPRDIANNTDSGLAQLYVLHSGLPLELFWWSEPQQPKCHLTPPIS